MYNKYKYSTKEAHKKKCVRSELIFVFLSYQYSRVIAIWAVMHSLVSDSFTQLCCEKMPSCTWPAHMSPTNMCIKSNTPDPISWLQPSHHGRLELLSMVYPCRERDPVSHQERYLAIVDNAVVRLLLVGAAGVVLILWLREPTMQIILLISDAIEAMEPMVFVVEEVQTNILLDAAKLLPVMLHDSVL